MGDHGLGAMAFVAGEAGIGKSYLVTGFAAAARLTGAIVATGGCPVRSEGELPLAAPIEAWRSLHRSLIPPLSDGRPRPSATWMFACQGARPVAHRTRRPSDRFDCWTHGRRP